MKIPKWSLPCDQPLSVDWPFLKMVVWQIRGSNHSHWPFSLPSRPNHCLVISSPPLCWRHTHAAHGGSPASDQHYPWISAGDELRCSSHWLPKVSPPTILFGKFRYRLTSFQARLPILEWVLNHLQNHLDGQIIVVEEPITIHTMPSTIFFRWIGEDSWGETPQNFMYSS